MQYRLLDGPMLGTPIRASEVGDPPVDLFYQPGHYEKLADGTERRGGLFYGPEERLPPERRGLPRYVFDPVLRGYVWRGQPPRREVHRGVVIERFE